ncbi:Uncharacterised protein [Chryseobacterium carnipullorum]|uniref:Uncharacterized protein n=1 Tax=Chryseobacterium carnipullorum TaxID=1124835 RepID=A0A376DTX1_CHRCU|nr:Uncharacterised protein [Chryseobacterium carnipullorum]
MVVEKHIINFAKRNDRRETLLYNNRCLIMYINPSQLRKDQYEANRLWILNHFAS